MVEAKAGGGDWTNEWGKGSEENTYRPHLWKMDSPAARRPMIMPPTAASVRYLGR